MTIDFFGNVICVWMGSRRDLETINLKYCPTNEEICYHFVRDKNTVHYTHIDFVKNSIEKEGKAAQVSIPHLYLSHQLEEILRYFRNILRNQRGGIVAKIEGKEIKDLIENLNTVVKEIKRRWEQILDNILI